MLKRTVEFLHEAGMLKKTPRTGYQFLGSGSESVAEHSFRATILGYVLAGMESGADIDKTIRMCLFHDLAEARTGDHNYVNKKYVAVDERKALLDQTRDLPFGDDILALTDEFNAAGTLEARIAKDADQLDLILELKGHQDAGNPNAEEWLVYALKRLCTESGKALGREIMTSKSDGWWFDKNTDWWVNGSE
ncbi:MAG: HD domain-containing protein [Deltaproteobacteria bacterium]|jgi:putative hydrolases of HD superfamily|nr:HD domain-containing protein [Deltaproteobacteria bacterium]